MKNICVFTAKTTALSFQGASATRPPTPLPQVAHAQYAADMPLNVDKTKKSMILMDWSTYGIVVNNVFYFVTGRTSIS